MNNEIQEYHLNELNGEPLLRIGLFDSQEFMDFKVLGKFSIQNNKGDELLKNINSDLKWRVKIKESTKGKEHYFLVLFESFIYEIAEERLEIARKISEDVSIRALGGEIYLDERKINCNVKYIVTYGDFPTEIEARREFKKFQPEFIPYIQKETLKLPGGVLEIFDAEYDRSTEAETAIRIVPEDINTKIKLFSVRTFDDILQKNHYSDQTFNGTIELRLDNRGNLMAISEIPLEKYLKRAIYSEVGTELPLEFLKSFAIVARSEAIARIKHKQLGETFDYCNTGHSLRYLGNDFEDENIEEAVESTRGQVLSTNDHIRDTPFHLVCGGHTEDASGIWGSVDRPFFKGRYDWKSVPKDFTTLKDEKMVRKWIESRPEVWCNLKGRKIPHALEKYKQYFRWELSYSRRELEDIIHKKTGEDVGTLFDIFPISRGNSGRLSEIELIGSLKNYRIKGLFNIREALAYDYLPSSCFIIEKELDETGTPIMFTFIGAGQGHGVGLCKTGAAVMAYEGNKKCEHILKHYFQESNIRSIYEIDLKDKKK